MHKKWTLTGLLACAASLPAWAVDGGSASAGMPANTVSLAATASRELAQDWVRLTLVVHREGGNPVPVHEQLKKTLANALQRARPAAVPGELEVSTGALSLFPRHGSDGRLAAWVGRAELVLAGRDLARISSLAGQLEGMVVGQAQWSFSPALRHRTEDEVQAEAVQRFRAKADSLARQFGFGGYALKEVQVSHGEPEGPIRPVMARAAVGVQSSPVPLEAASSAVSVTVSGTVQLKP